MGGYSDDQTHSRGGWFALHRSWDAGRTGGRLLRSVLLELQKVRTERLVLHDKLFGPDMHGGG